MAPGCYLSHGRDDAADAGRPPDAPGLSCHTEPRAGCAAWEPAGPLATVSSPLVPGELVRYGSAVVTDCGVLAL